MGCQGLSFVAIAALMSNVCSVSGNNVPARQPSRCYDCDYDPDQVHGEGQGHVATVSGDDRRGFPPCSLEQPSDMVRETVCESGICFIRKDSNGLVYRGCADVRNLPSDIDTGVQCRAQGLRPATWWFCNGTLCNSGRFGTGTVCGSTTSRARPQSSHHVDQSSGTPRTSGGYRVEGAPAVDEQTQQPVGRRFEEVQSEAGYGNAGQPVVYGGTGLNSEQAFQLFMSSNKHRVAVNVPMMETAPSVHVVPPSVGQKSSSSVRTSDQRLLDVVPPQSGMGYSQPTASKSKIVAKYPARKPEVTQAPTTTTSTTTAMTTAGSATTEIIIPISPDAQRPASAYKTWDFLLLAQSRLQKLGEDAKSKSAQQQQQQLSPAAANEDGGYRAKSPDFGSVGYASGNGRLQQQAGGKSAMTFPAPDAATAGSKGQTTGGDLSGSPAGGYLAGLEQSADIVVGQGSESEFNPCDFECRDNPSGLFPDSSGSDSFIQCGPGMDPASGTPCQCCRPHRMHCPPSTSFDHVTKVCIGSDPSQS